MRDINLFLFLITMILLSLGCSDQPIIGNITLENQVIQLDERESEFSGEIVGSLKFEDKVDFKLPINTTCYIFLVDSEKGFRLGNENVPYKKVSLKKQEVYSFILPYTIEYNVEGNLLVFDFGDSGTKTVRIQGQAGIIGSFSFDFVFDEAFVRNQEVSASGKVKFDLLP